jgi:hypothetical protein
MVLFTMLNTTITCVNPTSATLNLTNGSVMANGSNFNCSYPYLPPQPYVDYIPSGVADVPTPVGSVITFNVSVTNTGNEIGGNETDMNVTFPPDCGSPESIYYPHVSPIGPGLTTTFDDAFNCTCQYPGVESLTIEVNPSGNLTESNYGNDVETGIFFVCGPQSVTPTCWDYV